MRKRGTRWASCSKHKGWQGLPTWPGFPGHVVMKRCFHVILTTKSDSSGRSSSTRSLSGSQPRQCHMVFLASNPRMIPFPLYDARETFCFLFKDTRGPKASVLHTLVSPITLAIGRTGTADTETVAAHPTSYTGEYLRRLPGITPAAGGQPEPVLAAPTGRGRSQKGRAKTGAA